MRCWFVWVERKWGSAPLRVLWGKWAAAVAKSKQRDGSVLSCLTLLLAATVSIIKGRDLTRFNNSNVHVCEYFDEEPNCVAWCWLVSRKTQGGLGHYLEALGYGGQPNLHWGILKYKQWQMQPTSKVTFNQDIVPWHKFCLNLSCYRCLW